LGGGFVLIGLIL